MPLAIEIIDVNKGNIFLNFGDIEIMDPPNITKGFLCLSNFTNPLDLARLNQVMKDEGVSSSFKSAEMDYLISIQSLSLLLRNPCVALLLAVDWQLSNSPESKKKILDSPIGPSKPKGDSLSVNASQSIEKFSLMREEIMKTIQIENVNDFRRPYLAQLDFDIPLRIIQKSHPFNRILAKIDATSSCNKT